MAVLQGFSHVGVAVRDLDRSRRFYADVLGFEQLYALDFDHDEVAATMQQSGRFRSAMLRRGDVRIELLQWVDVAVSGDGPDPMTRLGLTHLSFRVERLEDHYDAVRAAGGAVLQETLAVLPHPRGGAPTRLVVCLDPDGTRVELMEGVPDLAAL